MSITYTSDAILESKADALVVPVNTVGVMGAGLAKAFARRWPALEREYLIQCAKGSLHIGSLFFWKIPRHTRHGQPTPRYVVCLPTKRDWRQPSRIEYVETGLRLFTQYYDAFEIESASFPRLGCGLGGLAWEQVKPLMEKHLAGLPIPVQIHLT